MSHRFPIALTGLCAILAGAELARAATVAVSDYNWLNQRNEHVTPFIGSTTGVGGSGYGEPADFRWGDFVWIPDGTLTGNGTADYHAGVILDTQREIEEVRVQWWANEGTSIKAFTVQGSNDGTSWTDIGSHDYGVFKTGSHAAFSPYTTTVDVTDSNWSRVRILVKQGDYTFGSAARGGPGLMAVEPRGDGIIPDEHVNWANQPSFGTTVSNNGFALFNGTRYNDGWLFDDDSVRTGEGAGSGSSNGLGWDANSWVQIDLTAPRQIGRAIVVWDFVWQGNDFNVQWSNDGTTFFPVAGEGAPTQFAGPHTAQGATQVLFNPTIARYFRIVDATGNASHVLLNQVMLLDLPEPAGAGVLLIAGALASMKRTRRK